MIELTKAQKRCVSFGTDRDLLVKGLPGAGKSVVLMQRALRLNRKAEEMGEPAKILLLAFTNSLVQYTSDMLEQTGLDTQRITVSTMDKIAWNLRWRISGRRPDRFISPRARERLVEEAMQAHLTESRKQNRFQTKGGKQHRFYEIGADFWAEEFRWIKQKNLTTQEQYIESERSGRGGKIRMSKADKALAYEIFEIYQELLQKSGSMDPEDNYLYLLSHEAEIPDSERYDYILVDEAQDLSFAQLRFAKRLAVKSITIAADQAQKIYQTTFSWKDLGIEVRGRSSKTLGKSFRSTKEIVELAESLMEVNRKLLGDQAEYSPPVIPERSGALPAVIRCPDAAAEQDFVMKTLRKYVEDGRTVGLLYRSYVEGETLRRWLADAGLEYEEVGKKREWSLTQPGVKLSTVHSAKGLEFDAVIIPQFQDGVFPASFTMKNAEKEQMQEILAQERSVLYVGMTRAKYELYLTYAGAPSRFLYEFDPEYYQFLLSSTGEALEKPSQPLEDEILLPF